MLVASDWYGIWVLKYFFFGGGEERIVDFCDEEINFLNIIHFGVMVVILLKYLEMCGKNFRKK